MDSKKPESVARSAGVMGVATLMSRFLGLAREQVFAYFFGAGAHTDAFQIAFRIPNLLRDLFAEGALSSALVPTFLKVRESEGVNRSWQVAARVFISLFVIVSLIAILGMIFSDSLVRLYAPGFVGDNAQIELTSRMTRTMFPFFPLVAIAAGFMAVLNALGYFFIPGFSSALFNLVSIITGVASSQWIQHQGSLGPFTVPIEGMAIGVVLGGLAQAGLQWPLLRKNGFSFRYRKKLGIESESNTWIQDPALKRMLFLMVPGTLGLAATQINILVNSILATHVGIGAVSWLNYAFRLMQFPIGVFGVSLAQANLSVFSKLWAKNEKQQALETLSQTLRQTLAVNFPAAAGLAALGSPIIAMIFQHGRFSIQDTEKTALVLSAYSVGLVGYSLVKVWVPVFYALGNTRIPVVSSVLSVALNLGLNLILVKSIGLVGLPLGVSGVALFNASFLVWAGQKEFLRHSLSFPMVSFLKSVSIHFLFSACVGLAAGGVSFGIRHFWPDFSQSFVGHLFQVFAGIGAALGVWVFMGQRFQISEVQVVLKIFLKKMKRKR